MYSLVASLSWPCMHSMQRKRQQVIRAKSWSAVGFSRVLIVALIALLYQMGAEGGPVLVELAVWETSRLVDVLDGEFRSRYRHEIVSIA